MCENIGMSPQQKNRRLKNPRKTAGDQRLRLVRHWVPDVRDPKVQADLRRQGRLLAKHSENDVGNALIEAVYDSSEWR
jgi:hypothetical protein